MSVAILFIIALIVFIVDAIGVTVNRVNLQSVGLAFLTGAFLVGAI